MGPDAAAEVDEARPHVAHFYADEVELDDAVARFLAEGLWQEEIVLVVATPLRRARLEQRIESHDTARALGRYLTLAAEETLAALLVDGRPDRARFDRLLGASVTALAGAGRPVRAFGEMVGLLWSRGDVLAAIELEGLWSELVAAHPLAVYCAYPMAAVTSVDDLPATHRACAAHTHLVGPGSTEVATGTEVFLPTPDAVGAVRQLVAGTLRARGAADALDDALLVSSELASNAVQHAGTPFRVQVEVEPDRVRISVTDADGSSPTPSPVGPLASRGRGLPIVEHLAASWGNRSVPGGKVVWADIARPSA